MELKKSITKQHYEENAKKYVINMKNDSKKLHKKNGCQHSKHLTEYYDFDTLEEIKNSNISCAYCHNCFDEDPLLNIKSSYTQKSNKKDKPSKFLYVIFAILFAIIGFMIMNNKIGGKIMGAILFIGIGLLIAFIVDLIINFTYTFIYMTTKKEDNAEVAYKAYRKSSVAFIIKIVLCVLLAILTLSVEFNEYHAPRRKYYDNHGNVHYSEEKRDEQNFINDMYGAAYDN